MATDAELLEWVAGAFDSPSTNEDAMRRVNKIVAAYSLGYRGREMFARAMSIRFMDKLTEEEIVEQYRLRARELASGARKLLLGSHETVDAAEERLDVSHALLGAIMEEGNLSICDHCKVWFDTEEGHSCPQLN